MLLPPVHPGARDRLAGGGGVSPARGGGRGYVSTKGECCYLGVTDLNFSYISGSACAFFFHVFTKLWYHTS